MQNWSEELSTIMTVKGSRCRLTTRWISSRKGERRYARPSGSSSCRGRGTKVNQGCQRSHLNHHRQRCIRSGGGAVTSAKKIRRAGCEFRSDGLLFHRSYFANALHARGRQTLCERAASTHLPPAAGLGHVRVLSTNRPSNCIRL